ncbi:hypothetical protein [Roseibium sp. TrichSKD4]|uniref:hypothetical protein n=1 Tax=Roseibium sp. TrichSKD4 TaxID=744980 RepID=UPI0006809E2F|nr:hypothetical protein [Roseibium sp. TrichSKD4]
MGLYFVQHKGPADSERQQLVKCHGEPLELQLAANQPLAEAVAGAMEHSGFETAWLEIADVPVEKLSYVIPAESPDDDHVAWYSDIKSFDTGRIKRLGMVVGKHQSATFIHGHGAWHALEGETKFGHVLAGETFLATDVRAKGIGIRGAVFDRSHDAETKFDLFKIREIATSGGDHALLRLKPNVELVKGVEQALQQLGWQRAKVSGLGSLAGAVFEDGSRMTSFATEFLITDYLAGEGAAPEIMIVGETDGDIITGNLTADQNPILVTAELVLNRT